MAEQLYRVVEATWKGGIRVETELSDSFWRTEKVANEERRKKERNFPSRCFSLQKKPKEVKAKKKVIKK